MTWRAATVVAVPCADTAAAASFLDGVAGGDLIVRLDDSVQSVEALGSDRYRASIAPLHFPGLTVEVVALIRIERIDAGLRYTTEGVRLNFTGIFRSAMVGVEELCDVAAVTELRARDGELAASGTFALELPLPRWIPERATAAGERLIQSIVAKDTRLTIERLQAEMDAERVGGGVVEA